MTIGCCRQLPQRLSSRLAPNIQEGFLTNTNRPPTHPLPRIVIVISRRSVVCTPIVPDGQVVGVLPSVPYLQILVFENQAQKPSLQRLGLQRRDVVDVLHMNTNREDGLPACHGIRADDRVDSLQEFASVERRASRVRVELEAALFGDLVELWLGKCSGEAFQKLLVRCRNAVVELIA